MDNTISLSVELPEGDVKENAQCRYGDIAAEIKLKNPHSILTGDNSAYNNLEIKSFLKFFGDKSDNTDVKNHFLSDDQKTMPASSKGAYIAGATYYPYCMSIINEETLNAFIGGETTISSDYKEIINYEETINDDNKRGICLTKIEDVFYQSDIESCTDITFHNESDNYSYNIYPCYLLPENVGVTFEYWDPNQGTWYGYTIDASPLDIVESNPVNLKLSQGGQTVEYYLYYLPVAITTKKSDMDQEPNFYIRLTPAKTSANTFNMRRING